MRPPSRIRGRQNPAYHQWWYQKNKKREQQKKRIYWATHRPESREQARRRRTRRTEFLRTFKHKPCADCQKVYHPVVMQFDHVRGKKLFTISSYPDRCSMKRLLHEIAKCDVVCANCHAMRTWKRRRK